MTGSRVVMEKLAENLWLVDGETVSFLGLPYRTRMTVIRLSDGGLWVHSPVRHSAELAGALAELGPVRYLVAPNALHHLFLKDWQQHCPAAEVYGTAKVMAKRPDIHFTGELGNAGMPWQAAMALCAATFKPSTIAAGTFKWRRCSQCCWRPIRWSRPGVPELCISVCFLQDTQFT